MKKEDIKRAMDWDGLLVVSLRELNNGSGNLPVGTEFQVTGYLKGLKMTSFKCSCCGFRLHISRVHPNAVELVDCQSNRDLLKWNKERGYVTAAYGRRLETPSRRAPTHGKQL